MTKTIAALLATSLAATTALPALAGGLDDAIVEAPVVAAPAPAPAGGLGTLGTLGAIAGAAVAIGIIAAVVDDDDDDDDDGTATTTIE